MAGFLVLPVVPVEFTSIITAVVWSLSGGLPALVFLVAGTFLRVDSVTIFSGIEQIVGHLFPGLPTLVDEGLSVAVMFAGNLGTAYMFKRLVRNRLISRLPHSSISFRLRSG